MAWVTVRCPRCGAYVASPASYSAQPSWATCPHCGTTLPIVAPRDPPPLFTWEVHPGVYPNLPPPRAPGKLLASFLAFTLLAAALLLFGVSGTLTVTGATALTPATYTVGGTVEQSTSGAPLLASVNVTGENGFQRIVATGVDGTFSIPSVPAGGITLNVTAPGFDARVVTLFLSRAYSSVGDPSHLLITMDPGAPTNIVSTGAAEFPDLETFVASLWSGAILLGLGALLSAAGALMAWRRQRPSIPTVAGVGAIVAPTALFVLGDTTALPYLYWAAGAIVVAGIVASTLGILEMAWAEPGSTSGD